MVNCKCAVIAEKFTAAFMQAFPGPTCTGPRSSNSYADGNDTIKPNTLVSVEDWRLVNG